MVDKVWGAAKAYSRQTQGRTYAGHEAGTWRTRGLKADTEQTQGGHMADTWRTRFGGVAKADSRWTQGGHEADTWRTRGGQAPGTWPEHIAASFFFLRENPTVNCLGKHCLLFTREVLLSWESIFTRNFYFEL